MSGLEKITEHIINKAQTQANEIIVTAERKAGEIKVDTEEKAAKMKAEHDELLKNECDKILQMAQSAARQQKRQAILKAKSDVIAQIINDAKNSIKNMDKKEYVALLKTLLNNIDISGEGELLFSKEDRPLITEDFITGKSGLKISDEYADIDAGFIIRYGKIEQNCSIDSIFEEKYNLLSDKVNEFLNS